MTPTNGSRADPRRRGRVDPRAAQLPLERENPDLLAAPAHRLRHGPEPQVLLRRGAQPPAHGGWAREVTVRELPVATKLAGVNMRLKPGGVREMHWHKEAEWAYMLAGRARITAIDAEGRNFIDDVGEGDLWNFPAGIPHSIQALEEGCEFLLVFDDGNFSENETFLITDWFAHTPPEVLAKNFGVPERAFADIPIDVEHERYIFPRADAGPARRRRASRRRRAPCPSPSATGSSRRSRSGARAGRCASSTRPTSRAATTIAAALVEVEPGGMRELHWHPNADEWQYYISRQGRMTVFASAGKARTFDYQAGDVGYVPFAMGHYVENTGDEPLRFLEMFRSDHFADVSLNQWMALTPPELVQAHLNLDGRRSPRSPRTSPSSSASSAEPSGEGWVALHERLLVLVVPVLPGRVPGEVGVVAGEVLACGALVRVGRDVVRVLPVTLLSVLDDRCK